MCHRNLRRIFPTIWRPTFLSVPWNPSASMCSASEKPTYERSAVPKVHALLFLELLLVFARRSYGLETSCRPACTDTHPSTKIKIYLPSSGTSEGSVAAGLIRTTGPVQDKTWGLQTNPPESLLGMPWSGP